MTRSESGKIVIYKRYTHSNMTIATASFKRLSPKITLYSLGSTLRVLKMARTVTGSVAERVEPKRRHSMIPKDSPSRPKRAQT